MGSFVPKTDWKYNDIVTENDMIRIEQGIADAHNEINNLNDELIAHSADKTKHVPNDKYVAYTSRSDQAPSWNDLRDKPNIVLSGTSNQDVSFINALFQQIDTRSVALSYDINGNITTITEKDGTTTVKTTTLTYNGSGQFTTAVEQVGGKTITITFSYDGNGNLTSVTRSVV